MNLRRSKGTWEGLEERKGWPEMVKLCMYLKTNKKLSQKKQQQNAGKVSLSGAEACKVPRYRTQRQCGVCFTNALG